MSETLPLFYDVPVTHNIAPQHRDPSGFLKSPPQMLYAIFSCPFEAMSFARRNSWGPFALNVNRRPWDRRIFEASRVRDYRGVEDAKD